MYLDKLIQFCSILVSTWLPEHLGVMLKSPKSKKGRSTDLRFFLVLLHLPLECHF